MESSDSLANELAPFMALYTLIWALNALLSRGYTPLNDSSLLNQYSAVQGFAEAIHNLSCPTSDDWT